MLLCVSRLLSRHGTGSVSSDQYLGGRTMFADGKKKKYQDLDHHRSCKSMYSLIILLARVGGYGHQRSRLGARKICFGLDLSVSRYRRFCSGHRT